MNFKDITVQGPHERVHAKMIQGELRPTLVELLACNIILSDLNDVEVNIIGFHSKGDEDHEWVKTGEIIPEKAGTLELWVDRIYDVNGVEFKTVKPRAIKVTFSGQSRADPYIWMSNAIKKQFPMIGNKALSRKIMRKFAVIEDSIYKDAMLRNGWLSDHIDYEVYQPLNREIRGFRRYS